MASLNFRVLLVRFSSARAAYAGAVLSVPRLGHAPGSLPLPRTCFVTWEEGSVVSTFTSTAFTNPPAPHTQGSEGHQQGPGLPAGRRHPGPEPWQAVVVLGGHLDLKYGQKSEGERVLGGKAVEIAPSLLLGLVYNLHDGTFRFPLLSTLGGVFLFTFSFYFLPLAVRSDLVLKISVSLGFVQTCIAMSLLK